MDRGVNSSWLWEGKRVIKGKEGLVVSDKFNMTIGGIVREPGLDFRGNEWLSLTHKFITWDKGGTAGFNVADGGATFVWIFPWVNLKKWF